MSSKRNTLKMKSKAKRMFYSPYQASDSEIQSDLRKLKYVSSKEIEKNPKISEEKIEKAKDEEPSDSCAVEMLAKLQTFREADKKQAERKSQTENKIIRSENRNCYNRHIEYPSSYDINYQNYISNMMLMSNINMFQYYQMSLNQCNPAYYNLS